MKRIIFSLLFFLVFAYQSAPAQEDSLRVSLLTCEPGTKIYELYGHTAIRIIDYNNGSDIVFNYGLFNFNAPHFIWRFSLGQTDYMLGADYYTNFARSYERRGSPIFEQVLNLSFEESNRLFALLSENYKPENSVYRYDFLHNNCATMALDKIEESIDGNVTYVDTDSTDSFRSILHKYSGVAPWSEFAIDLVLGEDADSTITTRQHAFIPIDLMKLVESAVISDSLGITRPLAYPIQKIIDPQKKVTFQENLLTPIQAMFIALLIVLFISLFDWHKGRISWWFDIIIFSIQGLAGLLVAFLYFFSEHPTVGSNWLILGLNPLPLICLPFVVIRIIKGRHSSFFIADFVVMISFIIISPLLPQHIQPATLILFAVFALRSISNYLLSIYIKFGTLKRSILPITKSKSFFFVLALLSQFSNISAQNNTDLVKTKLIVGIEIDQLDSENLLQLMSIFGDDGFKQIWSNSYNRPNVFHDYDDVDLASATASINCGTTPFYHGIVSEKWMNRKTLNVSSLVEDVNQDGINTKERISPKKLLASNLADEIKLSTNGRSKVCAIAIEREAAIYSAGHEADVAMWMNNLDNSWCTSNYYGELPAWTGPQNDFSLINKTWEPVFPTGFYLKDPNDETISSFSHTFKKDDVWDFRTSPMANDKVLSMALAAIDGMELGNDNITDLLLINFYGGNWKHKTDAPYSLEQQDIMVRLDQNISDLIRKINEKVGLENVLFFLTSSGYEYTTSPDLSGTRIPNGTISMERVTALLNLYLSAKYEQGSYIETYHNNHIYLNKELIEDKNISLLEITNCCVDFLSQVSGIKTISSLRDLVYGQLDNTAIRKRNGLNSAYSGDLIIDINPGWIISDEKCGTTYYQKNQTEYFPFFIWGNGVRSEIDHTPISVSALAPTIADISKIGIPNACTTKPIKNLK